MRILVVDTDVFIRRLLCNVLPNEDTEAGEAADYFDARAMIEAGNWDILLTALSLSSPHTGLDLARDAAVYGMGRVIMCHATDRQGQVHAMGLPLLIKPFSFVQLQAAIAAAVP